MRNTSGVEAIGHRFDTFQSQVVQQINQEVKSAMQRNLQETQDQKGKAAACFGTLKEEMEFLRQKIQENDQRIVGSSIRMDILERENEALRNQIKRKSRIPSSRGVGLATPQPAKAS